VNAPTLKDLEAMTRDWFSRDRRCEGPVFPAQSIDRSYENLYVLAGVSSNDGTLSLWLSGRSSGQFRLLIEDPERVSVTEASLEFIGFKRCTFWRVRRAPTDLLLAQCESGPIRLMKTSVPLRRMHDPDLFTRWPWILLYPFILVLVILVVLFEQVFGLFVAHPYWWFRRVRVGQKRRRRLRALDRRSP